jgi:hypothetical protein
MLIKAISAPVRNGLDLSVQVVLKYLQVQLQYAIVAQVHPVGIQVQCLVFRIQLKVELLVLHGHRVIVHIAIRYK